MSEAVLALVFVVICCLAGIGLGAWLHATYLRREQRRKNREYLEWLEAREATFYQWQTDPLPDRPHPHKGT